MWRQLAYGGRCEIDIPPPGDAGRRYAACSQMLRPVWRKEVAEISRNLQGRAGLGAQTNWLAVNSDPVSWKSTYEEKTTVIVWNGLQFGTQLVDSLILPGSLWREDLSAWSWRISTVKSRCQGKTDDTVGWKKGLTGTVVICEVWRWAIAL
jgi:hypothetical protein